MSSATHGAGCWAGRCERKPTWSSVTGRRVTVIRQWSSHEDSGGKISVERCASEPRAEHLQGDGVAWSSGVPGRARGRPWRDRKKRAQGQAKEVRQEEQPEGQDLTAWSKPKDEFHGRTANNANATGNWKGRQV